MFELPVRTVQVRVPRDQWKLRFVGDFVMVDEAREWGVTPEEFDVFYVVKDFVKDGDDFYVVELREPTVAECVRGTPFVGNC